MKLLNTTTLQLESFRDNDLPDYAIFSHTWTAKEQEVTYQQITKPDWDRPKTLAGYKKIVNVCQKAKEVGIEYAWVDTCCINKADAGELNQALNAMFSWYRGARVCYTYLSDVPTGDNPEAEGSKFQKSRWWTRGWTLQELLAPLSVVFFDENWNEIGTKASLQGVITKITEIPGEVLLMNADQEISIAQRMAWAARRETSCPEDRAYSMMGLFGVSMPMIYGEGEMAFRRLQLEIIKVSNDQSIFAWKKHTNNRRPSQFLLAASPDDFKDCLAMRRNDRTGESLPYDITNAGLRISLPLVHLEGERLLAVLGCTNGDSQDLVGIPLEQQTATQFMKAGDLEAHPHQDLPLARSIFIRTANPSSFYVEDWMRPEPEYVFLIRCNPALKDVIDQVQNRGDEVVWSFAEYDNVEYIRLKFDRSGRAGVLLFQGAGDQNLAVIVGMHNYNIWCDIQTTDSTDISQIWDQQWGGDSLTRWENLDRKKLSDSSIAVHAGQIGKEKVYRVNLKVGAEFISGGKSNLIKLGCGKEGL